MHPIAGLLAGYAATNAGFTASLIVCGTDALLAPVTEAAAQVIDPATKVGITANWYFMIVSVFTLTIAGVFVNHRSSSWQIRSKQRRWYTSRKNRRNYCSAEQRLKSSRNLLNPLHCSSDDYGYSIQRYSSWC